MKRQAFKIGQQVATASGDIGIVVGWNPSTTRTVSGEPVYVVAFGDAAEDDYDEDYFSESELEPVR